MYKRIVMIVEPGIEMDFVSSYALLIAKLSSAQFYLVPAFRDPEISTNVEAIEIRAEKEGIETEHLSIEEDVVRSVNKLVRDKKMLAPVAKVIREKKELQIPAREVVVGDIILLSEGDCVPADGRLIEQYELKVNNAPLTGESIPQTRSTEPESDELMEAKNIVFSGTTTVSGSGKAVVFATGMGTEFGKIAGLTQELKAEKTPLQKEIGFFKNKHIFLGIVTEMLLILAFAYILFFQQFLGTGPLELKHWLFFVPFAILIFVAEEIRKWLTRWLERRKPQSKASVL